MKKQLWLDCDPGHDDVMAILLAAFHPDSQLLGLSTVAGNQSVEKTTANAWAVLSALGLEDLPLISGMGSAIMGPMPFCAEIHGNSGLDGADGQPLFPWKERPADPEFWLQRWARLLQQAWDQTGQPIDMVCTGSLTNLALLITLFPDLRSKLRVSLMGGALGIGNTGPVAEFNIENDPEAAAIVFQSGMEIAMVPLEVTHTALVTREVLAQLGDHTPFRLKIRDLLLFFRDTYLQVFGFPDPPLHDPLAVWYALEPQAFKGRKMRVDIETRSELSRGQTVCDFYGRSSKTANAYVCLEADIPRFWEVMLQAVNQADAQYLG